MDAKVKFFFNQQKISRTKVNIGTVLIKKT